jgi:hypothetical protein
MMFNFFKKWNARIAVDRERQMLMWRKRVSACHEGR